jgi:putative transposase
MLHILANKTRDPQRHLYHKLLRYIEPFHPQKKLILCPFNATVIPLMSKLFWLQGYRQLKLITTLNQDTKSTGCLLLSPGQEHEINFGEDMVKMLPGDGVASGIEGFVVAKYLSNLCVMVPFLSSVSSPTGNGMKTILLR